MYNVLIVTIIFQQINDIHLASIFNAIIHAIISFPNNIVPVGLHHRLHATRKTDRNNTTFVLSTILQIRVCDKFLDAYEIGSD